MVRNNHYELNKCTIASWADKGINQALSQNKIMNKFKATKL
jgi:hypothetical protein